MYTHTYIEIANKEKDTINLKVSKEEGGKYRKF